MPCCLQQICVLQRHVCAMSPADLSSVHTSIRFPSYFFKLSPAILKGSRVWVALSDPYPPTWLPGWPWLKLLLRPAKAIYIIELHILSHHNKVTIHERVCYIGYNAFFHCSNSVCLLGSQDMLHWTSSSLSLWRSEIGKNIGIQTWSFKYCTYTSTYLLFLYKRHCL